MSTALAVAIAALEGSVQSIWPVLASGPLASGPGAEVASRRILFTSPRHGAGTTTLAACTAVALRQNLRARVALVEANPFQPALAAYAGIPPAPGFADVMREKAAGDRVLRESAETGLSLVPGGSLDASGPIDWRGANTRLLFEDELRKFPFALIDAPPLLDRPAARLLLGFSDLTVLVVRAGVSSKDDTRLAAQVLRDSGVPFLGVILNRFRSPLPFA